MAESGSAYAYVDGNPLNGTDPSGLLCVTLWDDNCKSFAQQFKEDHPQVAQHITNAAGGALQLNPFFQVARGVGALTDNPIDLSSHGVQPCSGWYHVGEVGMAAVDLWAGAGVLSEQLNGAPLVGRSSALFGRGGGLLNSNNLVRLGWGWSAPAGREVLRLAIGSANSPFHWHLDIL